MKRRTVTKLILLAAGSPLVLQKALALQVAPVTPTLPAPRSVTRPPETGLPITGGSGMGRTDGPYNGY